ncbi:thioredoxin X [Hibiscus syriacus]|uniref:Thioredoxin X n=1 Tax=Hibiscus syriacus TaxID=106335 RepID=A0A6A2Y7Z8_HIBSY|nr:E2F-associated phosphoprotein-like [Hibiscus syriacus]KAE8677885.1 thioredoxin X [Hibiscus syriacus]
MEEDSTNTTSCSSKPASKMEEDATTPKMDSPTNSQQTVSDDDEIDYSIKPEFYDPKLDDKDELWVQKERKGRISDAVLSCPACFTTICLECQRHEKCVTEYRAIFVVICKIENEIVRQENVKPKKSGKRSEDEAAAAAGGETFKAVCCLVCSTEVGVIDEDEVYHFFNVLPSES